MEARKIQLIGNRSYSVSLPKQWIMTHNLKKQDTVFIDTNKNNELVIKVFESRNDDMSIDIRLSNVDNIAELLMLCYVKNIDFVTIHVKSGNHEKIQEIKRILHYLDGYDITSEDEKRIEISFLFKDINININKILIRMIYLLKMQLVSFDHRKALEENEITIDKLYHLSKRILFSCIHNQKLRDENGLTSYEEVFFYRSISKRLENIGDSLLNITKSDSKQLYDLFELMSDIIVKKKRINDEKERLRMLAPKFTKNDTLKRIYDHTVDIFENAMSIELSRTYF